MTLEFRPTADPHALDLARANAGPVGSIQWHAERPPRMVVGSMVSFTLGELMGIVERLQAKQEERLQGMRDKIPDDEFTSVCIGCQRPELHKMCPAYGSPYYMSGVELPAEIAQPNDPRAEELWESEGQFKYEKGNPRGLNRDWTLDDFADRGYLHI